MQFLHDINATHLCFHVGSGRRKGEVCVVPSHLEASLELILAGYSALSRGASQRRIIFLSPKRPTIFVFKEISFNGVVVGNAESGHTHTKRCAMVKISNFKWKRPRSHLCRWSM